MKQSKGYDDKKHRLCLLKRSFYGLNLYARMLDL